MRAILLLFWLIMYFWADFIFSVHISIHFMIISCSLNLIWFCCCCCCCRSFVASIVCYWDFFRSFWDVVSNYCRLSACATTRKVQIATIHMYWKMSIHAGLYIYYGKGDGTKNECAVLHPFPHNLLHPQSLSHHI